MHKTYQAYIVYVMRCTVRLYVFARLCLPAWCVCVCVRITNKTMSTYLQVPLD